MSATAPPRPRAWTSVLDVPEVVDVPTPGWLDRLPDWAVFGGVLVVLLAIAGILHSRDLGGELWFAEAGAVGVAHQSLSALPGALRAAGDAPLYYLLLHVWMDVFGAGQMAVRALSLLVGLLTIPAAMGVGWSLGGRRAAVFGGVMFAFSAFLIRFSQEAQPYALSVLLGLLATAGLVHGFVYRRRRWLWLFWFGLAALLYTETAGLLFWAGAAVAIAVLGAGADSPDRRPGIVRDAAVCFAGAFVVYLPWLPTTISQIAHDTFPWHYAPVMGFTLPSQLLGSERVDMTLLVALLVGVAPLWTRARRRSPEALVIWSLLALVAASFIVGRLAAFAAPVWTARYFAPVVAPFVFVLSLAAARARVVGWVALACCVAFLANYASFAPAHKSDMRDIAGELGPLLHAGDVVAVGQPEQAPLAWYYLPAGVRYVTSGGGTSSQPMYMNWSGAQARLQRTRPAGVLDPLVASLRPGQQLLYVRPLTEGIRHWSDPWTELVRRRSAQWGAVLEADVANGTLRPVAWAPHNYPSACCIANAAVLYEKR